MNKKKRSSKRNELIYIGWIRKTHGVKGEVSAEILTDKLGIFEEAEKVCLLKNENKKEVKIIEKREHKGRLIIKFGELNTIEEAKEWVGGYIGIPPYAFVREADEYRVYEINGLEVVDEDGKKCGNVIEVKDYSGNCLLIIRAGKKEVMVPFVKEYCDVELEKGRVVIEKRKWEELNEI